MKLIDIAMANIAAGEMAEQPWPYDLALALVKIKKATADEAAFYISKERDIALEYAEFDGGGNMVMTSRGAFKLRDPSKAGEYERLRSELARTETPAPIAAIRVRPPAEIRPAWISALEGFIDFSGGDGA